MVPYKRIDLIVAAFKEHKDKKLVVIGDGPEMDKIKAVADGARNITFLGFQNNEILVDHMQRAKAFVFAAEEDFGIVPVEAQACGTPVIAYGAGGALETVIDANSDKQNGTGIFFKAQDIGSLSKAICEFDSYSFDPNACRANAEKFSNESFKYGLTSIVIIATTGFILFSV